MKDLLTHPIGFVMGLLLLTVLLAATFREYAEAMGLLGLLLLGVCGGLYFRHSREEERKADIKRNSCPNCGKYNKFTLEVVEKSEIVTLYIRTCDICWYIWENEVVDWDPD